MPVVETNDRVLLQHVGDNRYVILKYLSELCGEECADITAMFNQLSNEEEYKYITFLRINSENNPIAKQFLAGIKPVSFQSIIKAGCSTVAMPPVGTRLKNSLKY